jgi:uncharacterized protein (DUF433 family)
MSDSQEMKEPGAGYSTGGVNTAHTVRLSAGTYSLLQRRARQVSRSLDAVADEMLQRELQPAHPYITTEVSRWGERAIVAGTRIPVSAIIGYVRLGVKPEAFAAEVHPSLTPAHIHDALSYYYDHLDEVERELAESTEESVQHQLRAALRSDEDYARLSGQSR